jgi:gamma-glutamyltranspeptidase / glutathione hydrolase
VTRVRVAPVADGRSVRGVVAAGHRASAQAGARILAEGGNAVDAAIAASFAGAVCEGPLTGPGAGGFLLVAGPRTSPVFLDFFVAVPGLGPDGRRLDPADLDACVVPFGDAEQVFHIGPASVAVPGMLQGLFAAWARFGHMPLAELAAPAIELARDGVEVGPATAYLWRILAGILTAAPEAAAIYAPDGRLLGEGEVFRNPALAETLEEIARSGPVCIGPHGWLAQRIVEGVAAAGGLVTATDMADYRVVERPALEVEFRGRRILTNPPPSSGGVLIAAALSRLASRPPARDDVSRIRHLVDAGEFANGLRTDAFASRLHALDGEGVTDWTAVCDGTPPPPVTRGPNGTTHISVMDRDGMVASLSSSNGAASGVMIPGTGFLLNNMMGEADLNPGGFGSMDPGMRMTSMMAPTIVMDGHVPSVALGSAGSNRLRSAILQTLAGIIDDGLGVPEAVARPRVHPEGGGVDVEGGIPGDVASALESPDRPVRRWGDRNLFFGGVSAVGRSGDRLEGAGDPRRGGAAFGVTATSEVIELSTR